MSFKNMNVKIGDRRVGDGCPSYIVAEMSCNHRQDYSIAERTIDAIAETGADAVKLQTARPEALTLKCNREEFIISGGTPWDGRTLYDLYCETQTPWEWHKPLMERARKKGLGFFSSPFDLEAVEFLADLGVPAFKIASFEAVDPQLIRAAAKHNLPVIISTGISMESDIELGLQTCRSVGNENVILTKCTSAYPAPLSAANLRALPAFRERFNCLVGLSDHTVGNAVAVGSVAVGGCFIEKHIILDRSLGGPDAGFSMEPSEFKEMVTEVRQMEGALGSAEIDVTVGSGNRIFARSLFVVEEIKKGDILDLNNVRSIRPGHGLPPKELELILGRRAKLDIARGTPLSWELID